MDLPGTYIEEDGRTSMAFPLLRIREQQTSMVRRISALIGIALLLAILVSLIWTVHLHRKNTTNSPDDLVRVNASRAITNQGVTT